MFQGTIPVVDAEYDLSDPADTGKTVATSVVGVTMMFAIFAAGRAAWNRLSQETDAVSQVEVL
ncbi:hypothetical protein EXE53_16710 [Halorubrum sp. SD626R]|uniref:hypothetical protein n=1 Tax=Halorubrum sp. SD626R TaxID=1419722 RepID=UPI0010F549DE|nr:hypothetical protein [Halorubrum sp. SD626R]TKX79269.1 hypothetical protein EXE53_16710 [Halorubrum sp. SD626R]